MDEDLYSKYFEVEEAIRQGSGLSAILYAQHAGKIIEELDEEDINDMAIGEMKVPAIGWQDDITVILNNENTEEEIIKKLEESAERNRIIFSEDKCKTLNIGKKDRNIVNKETIMGGNILKSVEEEKVLGHIFNNKNNNMSHINKKTEEVTDMVASMGLTIHNSTMEKVYMESMIIINNKCLIPKLTFGLLGFKITKLELDQLEATQRKIFRNFANLPASTPKIAILNEFGAKTITSIIKQKKLMMWHRLNQNERNPVIKESLREQVRKELHWYKQMVEIGTELNIELDKVHKSSKAEWKKKVEKNIKIQLTDHYQQEINKTKRYKNIIIDQVKPGESKIYMKLNRKEASAMFRARTGLLDPTPRKPYWDIIWSCKFCHEKSQDSQHYIVQCPGTESLFKNQEERFKTWNIVRTLDCDMITLERAVKIINKIYNLISKQDILYII